MCQHGIGHYKNQNEENIGPDRNDFREKGEKKVINSWFKVE